ncbi:MAG: tetratricopeptide repeat protein [Pirellulaceae bacterium]
MPNKRPKPNRRIPAEDQAQALMAALRLHQRGQLSRAEKSYKKILIRETENAVAHHLLGRLYYQTQRSDAAIASLQRAVAVQPNYPDALMDLANMLHDQGQYVQAEECLLQVIRRQPNNSMPHNNLGVLYKDQQRFDEALVAYRRSVELDASNSAALGNLARALSRIEDFDGAIQIYRRLLEVEPANIEALKSLASVLRRAGRLAEAIEVFSRWLALEPDNPVARHLLSACTDTATPQRASDEYVREVFDNFASTFEADLARLSYRGPKIMEQALSRELGEPNNQRIILDAGCGTGLCGPVLRPYAQRLIGVDISRKMLDVAERRTLYDELIESELGLYLSHHTAEFDLIASADTFGYFGDLATLLQMAHSALRSGGLLLATLEVGNISPEQGYHLQSSGRYCHNREYVRLCCETAGFTIRSLHDDTLRIEAEQAVPVVVLLAQSDTRKA